MTEKLLAELLEDLDGTPVTHLSLRTSGSEVSYGQRQGWYWEIRRDGRIVQRGIREEPLTRVEMEYVLRTLEA